MKFSFFCTRLTSPFSNLSIIALLDPNTQLGLLPFKQLRFLSSLKREHFKKKQEQGKESFTISYLVNFCGLSSDAAKSASKYVLFDKPDKPNAFLSLLKDDLGITNISAVIRKRPDLLLLDVNSVIWPKIRFFRSIGFSVDDLQKLIRYNPSVLCYSLERCFMPLCDILKKRLLLSDHNVAVALRRMRSQFNANILSDNISVLNQIGMPNSIICLLVTRSPFSICKSVDKFSEVVTELVGMGFDPCRYVFASALIAKQHLSTRTWKCKIDAFAEWGLSEDKIFSGFRKNPLCFKLSAESIRKKMDFLVNKMGWQPSAIIQDPCILGYNLEKRIVPRCSVVRVLFLRGLIKGEIKLYSVIKSNNNRFLDKYVIKYQEQVAELLDIFQGKLNIEELGFGFDENGAASLV